MEIEMEKKKIIRSCDVANKLTIMTNAIMRLISQEEGIEFDFSKASTDDNVRIKNYIRDLIRSEVERQYDIEPGC